MNKNYLKEIKLIFVIGILLIIISPYLLTRYVGLINFSNSGQVGDTIGGLTAPLTNLLGSILVFYALKAQIDANQLIQQQIDSQKTDEEVKKRVLYLFDNFKILREDINDYSVYENVRIGNTMHGSSTQMIIHNGASAFNHFISFLRDLQQHQYEEAYQIIPKLSELKNLLDSIESFINQVQESQIPNEDKIYLKNLMAYQFNSKIKSPFKANEKHRAKTIKDKDGIEFIQGIPNDLFDLVNNIIAKLK